MLFRWASLIRNTSLKALLSGSHSFYLSSAVVLSPLPQSAMLCSHTWLRHGEWHIWGHWSCFVFSICEWTHTLSKLLQNQIFYIALGIWKFRCSVVQEGWLSWIFLAEVWMILFWLSYITCTWLSLGLCWWPDFYNPEVFVHQLPREP